MGSKAILLSIDVSVSHIFSGRIFLTCCCATAFRRGRFRCGRRNRSRRWEGFEGAITIIQFQSGGDILLVVSAS